MARDGIRSGFVADPNFPNLKVTRHIMKLEKEYTSEGKIMVSLWCITLLVIDRNNGWG